ncbi:efflux RND transporter periplasmic adaptor subunit [Pontibacter qinzhouensis]|uniref:Efflux RND transporter periplasmic adaptor subunit n=1 Tax=Pontibacter qinzhouensis TaxID=2603253 RepID=A0A5C8JAR3_9BACT|nr:efflux RND transporter periplasmic adaptor subunit [Pontibacter qinzhouensis]TXK33767.1 efflux RND transporter periplasmic adaptor subunit [Pontibacter qinzhouensis]
MNLHNIYLVAVSLFILGCTAQGQPENPSNDAPALPVTKLITKDTTLHNDYVSDIQAKRHVEIRARVDGFLDQVYVDEGQEVKKGQPLFRVNPAEYEAELAKAKANYDNAVAEALTAEVEVKRVRLLVEKAVISKSELDVAKARHKAAQARIEEARSAQDNAATRLSYTFIKAPFSGIIDRIPLKTGSLISEGALLTTLSDLQAVYAYFEVSEKEYLTYAKALQDGSDSRSSQVQLILADGTPYPLMGEIETMEGVFEPNTGSIAFRASFPNPKKLLKHHSSGKIRLSNAVDGALLVPQKATFEIQDKNFVYVVDKDNKVRIKNFEPKARLSHFYIVASGLEEGESVVYEGVHSLREGLSIEPELVLMDSLLVANPG